MKKLIRFFVLLVMVLQLTSGSLPLTSAQENQPLVGDNPQTAPVGDQGGMPGWPVPDKPIPQHEPGAPSRAGSYSTQVNRLNAEGGDEVVTLTGLEAMLADGVIDDPLAGSYRLVSKEDIALGVYDISHYSIELKTYKDNAIVPVTDSEVQLAPDSGSGHQSLDLAAGDLNGDGVDEQIAAWVDVDTRHIMLAIGEMPGTDGRSSSEPAAAASGDQVDLLVRGYDRALWQAHYNGTTWGGWSNDGGGLLLSGPAMASRGSAAFDVFAVGTDNQVWRRSWDGASWGGAWAALPVDPVFTTVPAWVGPPPELEAPAAVARGADAFDVFRVAPDRTLRWSHFNGSSWSSWSGLGGMFAYGPGAVLLEDGSIQVFAIGVDQSLWYLHSMGTGWEMDGSVYHWQRVELEGMDPGVKPVSAPSAVRLPTGEVRVFVRALDDNLWQITYDGSWGAWSKGGAGLASRPTAVVPSSGLILFGLTPVGSLQQSTDGTIWGDLDQPWLPACCLGTPIDTGIYAYATAETNPVDQLNLLDIETGHFLGDGRQQIALAYTWAINEWSTGTGIGLKLFDVNDGFRTLNKLGQIDSLMHPEDYYPKIAAGEFDGDAPQEIALAYATRMGSVRVYTGENYTERQIAWLKPRIPDPNQNNIDSYYFLFDDEVEPFYGSDMNNSISSIKVASGWKACVLDQDKYLDEPECFTGPSFVPDLGVYGLDNNISYVYVEMLESSTAKLVPPDVTDGIYNQRNAYIALEIFDIDPQARTLVSQVVDYYEMWFTDTDDYPAPERTLGIVAGDFDGTPNVLGQLDDEIALIWDKVCRGDLCSNYRAYFHILDVEPGEAGLNISDHNDRPIEIEKFALDMADPRYPLSAEINLTTGDFDGDGKDEIARTWPREFEGGLWPNLDRKLQVLDWEDEWKEYSLSMPDSSIHNYEDALAAGDLNQDLRDEIVYNEAYNDMVEVYSFTPPNLVQLSSVKFENDDHDVFVLATGNFTGEGIRVGPPTYREQNQMTTPVMFLNLPPMHRDIIYYGGQNQVIEAINDASALYNTTSSAAEVYSTESKREWELSIGLETSAGACGSTVTASMANTYGENFSKATTQITERVISDQTNANIFDQIIYNGTNYAIWEYPVLGAEADNPDQAQTISVVWPLTDQTTLPNTKGSTWCDEYFYTPGHQLYNIWSYDHTALGDDGFKDLGEKILVKSTTSGTDIDMRMSENSGAERSEGYHNQISAGLEYSYESSLNIPFVGNVYDFSFRAYANGSYDHEYFSTFSTEVTEDTGVSISYPSTASLSEIKIYLYWAKAGYLAVDYQTLPDSQQLPWSLYQEPDPAFILPWYGFPDPADPIAPICGYDKKLFSHDIELDPAYVQNGDTVTMTATVRNFSARYATLPSQVPVWFYLGFPEANHGNKIGECTISGSSLNRVNGPQQCETTWVVSGGSGDEKIHAVIDPMNAFAEMHEDGDLINNNIGYGLLNVANADYQDPGLREKQAYQAILFEKVPGLGFGLYLPTTNQIETMRYELVPTDLGKMQIVGDPIQVLAFSGGAQEPDVSHTLGPTPAGMVVFYRDADMLAGMVEANLKLYRRDLSGWVEATCPGYELYRFVDDNIIVIPICQTGTFVLSDLQPITEMNIYLPIITD